MPIVRPSASIPTTSTAGGKPFLPPAFFVYAEHVYQLEGGSPLSNLMEVKD
jgi:hypothetical protein